MFIQYDVDAKPQVKVPEAASGYLSVTAVDPMLGRPVEIETDLLVLATGITPHLPANLTAAFGVQADRDGFFAEAESKWRPVDALKDGVFACGLALSPRSIPEAVATASAAAQRSLRILSHENLPAGKTVAAVRHSLCSLCERCVEACPYQARLVDANLEKLVVNPTMCQGCGECASVCPNGAAVVYGFNGKQFLDVIDAALEEAIHPTMS
jgi:heterodisulfide reductase subunit A